jgi:DNA-binding response OmpR family regulator
MKKVLVLVVEKDRAFMTVVAGALRGAGFDVAVTANTADGLNKIYQIKPDVVIASTDLPPVNGEDACQRIRQASYLPLLVLGGREELVETLELGADAFIVKPASGEEVVARVNSLIRRIGNGGPPEGGARLRMRHYLPGETVGPDRLTPTECRLSTCLLFNEGKLLGYPELIARVWGSKEVSVDTLHYYIRRLRRKLADFNIFCVRGVGYGLSAGGQRAS